MDQATRRRTTYELNGKVYEAGPGYSLRQAKVDGAVFIGASTIADLGAKYSSEIPARYFVASADHESGFACNEVDYEPPGKDGHVFISKGLYQVSDTEARDLGMDGDLLDPDFSTRVFAKLQERRLDFIRRTIRRLYAVNPRIPDVWGFMALAHNEGNEAVEKTLRLHGDDWSGPGGYAQRNAGRSIVKYGNDCMTGGPYWAAILAARYP